MSRARVAAGLIAVAIGTTAFVALADAATEGDDLAAFDPHLTATVVDHRIGGLTSVARVVTTLGEIPVLTGLTVIVALFLRAGTRRWQPALVLVVGMLGAAGLTYGLKLLIGRQRPDSSIVLGTVSTGFSFPSGHSLSSLVFFALLAALLWRSNAAITIKIAVVALAVLLSAAVGLSRIYLGYHWATDVLGGWTLALTWLCLLATAVHLIGQRSRRATRISC
ncbi:phosphatase PAP2 family protein [Kribbella antibiotica]|uniref:Phosphatase PAP2 family protein n=1 Tax=Kribbella antibiotica TaxID=190195 RepID=A0A4R4ZIQ0_9ACTN|nr:phosphatase PAP2 family protein [Kribbella antibiotica]TDD58591.1 phosphatase PAP2 family protein [Kribbella antibiotica]